MLKVVYIKKIQGSTKRNIQFDVLVKDITVSFKLHTGAECYASSLGFTNELTA